MSHYAHLMALFGTNTHEGPISLDFEVNIALIHESVKELSEENGMQAISTSSEIARRVALASHQGFANDQPYVIGKVPYRFGIQLQ